MSWREYRRKNFKSIQLREKTYHKKNRKRRVSAMNERYESLKLEVFSKYCKGKPYCQCPGCSRSQMCFLQLDHKVRGKRKVDSLTGERLWYWLKTHGYPKGFQVLCACCNFSKRHKKKCPMHGKKH